MTDQCSKIVAEIEQYRTATWSEFYEAQQAIHKALGSVSEELLSKMSCDNTHGTFVLSSR